MRSHQINLQPKEVLPRRISRPPHTVRHFSRCSRLFLATVGIAIGFAPQLRVGISFGAPPKSGDAGSRAGEIREDNSLKLKLVWCPPGEFLMGSPKHAGYDDEVPAVQVRLSDGFWLGQTEVTQAQWQAVMGTQPWSGEENVPEGAEYPATYMSHEEALAFCKKLSDQERAAGRLPSGWLYALPTEAQWEYACRAGTTTLYSFGDDSSRLSEFGWWGSRVTRGNARDWCAHHVRQKKPNSWGFYDMHGNVYEFCTDWYGADFYKHEAYGVAIDPAGPSEAQEFHVERGYHVLRGGDYREEEWQCRSAQRWKDLVPSFGNIGFRIAMSRVASIPSSVAYRLNEVHVLRGHEGSAFDVAVTPDGRELLSTGIDGLVRVWDLKSGDPLRQFQAHPNWAVGLAVSADGRRVVTSGNDRTIRIWDLELGTQLRLFEGHTNNVWPVAISRDGKQALSGSHDGTVRLWDVQTGKELRRFEGHAGEVWGVDLSPDGKLALSSDTGGSAHVWDTVSGQELRQLRTGRPTVTMGFAPDGKTALSGSTDGLLRMWDVETGEELRKFSGHTNTVRWIAYSPDGQLAATTGYDETVRVWVLSSGEELARYNWPRARDKACLLFGLTFTPDGRRLAVASSDSLIRILELTIRRLEEQETKE